MDRSRLFVVILLGVLVLLSGCAMLPDGSGGANPNPPSNTTENSPSESSPNGTIAVHNINVGQSVATLIVGPTGETMLIDTGNFSDDGEYVLSYLKRHGIEEIDFLVTSHNDADHIGGHAAVIEYYETEADGVGAVYDPGIAANTRTYEQYLDAVEEYDVRVNETREGDSIPFENVDVEVLGPPADSLSDGARNENSLVLRLEFGQTSFLFTGDAEDAQEAYLVEEHGSALNSTIYKAGHHGSYSSSSESLLDAVTPQVVVISSAFDSPYGHPHNVVLKKFAERSLPTYWTATHGNIVFTADGRGISISTQQTAPTDPLSLYAGESVGLGSDTAVTKRQRIATGSDTLPKEPGSSEDLEVSGDLAIETLQYDAAGDDYENLNDEYIVFENNGDKPLNLSDWTVEDEISRRYTFPAEFTLDPGATVTLRSGNGTDTATELYWDADIPVWNNGGDTVTVRTAEGEPVLMEEYS